MKMNEMRTNKNLLKYKKGDVKNTVNQPNAHGCTKKVFLL